MVREVQFENISLCVKLMQAKRNICCVKLLLTCSRFRTVWKVWLLL